MLQTPVIVRPFGTVSGITEQPAGIDFGLSGDLIKSIQSGVASGASTINAVDTTKSFARLTSIGATTPAISPYIVLTNSTTVTVTNVSGSNRWEVIELKKVKSIQSGNTAGSTTLNITISSINISNSSVFFSYGAGSATSAYILTAQLVSATSLQFISSAAVNYTANWFVVEWQ